MFIVSLVYFMFGFQLTVYMLLIIQELLDCSMLILSIPSMCLENAKGDSVRRHFDSSKSLGVRRHPTSCPIKAYAFSYFILNSAAGMFFSSCSASNVMVFATCTIARIDAL